MEQSRTGSCGKVAASTLQDGRVRQNKTRDVLGSPGILHEQPRKSRAADLGQEKQEKHGGLPEGCVPSTSPCPQDSPQGGEGAGDTTPVLPFGHAAAQLCA